jgi:predicted dehydrogenase
MLSSITKERISMVRKDSIGVGIIGTGFARKTQVPAFRACPGARVVSIASARRANAESAANEFDIEHFTDDWRELVSRDDVDLVCIATPPVTHLEMTLAALDGGKAVLCEKPMAMNSSESEAMQERAGKSGTLALIDHELRFLPGRKRMRELLMSGDIGNVYHTKLLFRADSRADASRPWNWWSDQEAGGGALGAIGSHAVDAFRWLLNSKVTHVFGVLTTHVLQRTDKHSGDLKPVTTDDEANLTLRFADSELTTGATGTISLSVVESGRPEHRLEVFGSNGALMIEGNRLYRANTGDGEWRPVNVEQGELAHGMSDNEWSRGFTTFSKAIVKALREGATTLEGAATFGDGHRTQMVLDATRVSNESGCWVTVAN